VPRQYNTAAYESLPKPVKTIRGFGENPEQFSQRNRICRTDFADGYQLPMKI
jgi:hypothetical protein